MKACSRYCLGSPAEDEVRKKGEGEGRGEGGGGGGSHIMLIQDDFTISPTIIAPITEVSSI